MKKIIVSLGLFIFASHSIAHNSPTTNATFLYDYEHVDLQYLYDIYQKDPLSFKTYGSGFIHSRLILVEKHIQVIEHIIRPENIWKKQYELLGCGLFLTGIFGVGCFIITKEFLQSYTEFMSKKFKKLSIPFSWIESLRRGEDLPDKQFSSKEKRYLKKFSFEKVESRNSWTIGNTRYTQTWTVDPLKFSSQMREKFNYLALEYNIPLKKRDLIFKGLFSTGGCVSTACLGLWSLYQAFYQEDILKEQLQQAKEVLKFLRAIENSR